MTEQNAADVPTSRPAVADAELPDVTEPRLSTAAVGRNVVIALVANVLTPAAALLTSPLLAHALGVDGRGALAAGTAPLLLAAAVGTFGIPDAVTFAVARTSRVLGLALRRGTTLVAASGVLATVAAILASTVLSGDDPSIGRLIILGSLATAPTLAVTVLRAAAAGLQMWRRVLAEQAMSAGTRLVLLIAFDVAGRLNPTSATLIMAFTPVVAGLVYLPLIKRARAAAGPVRTGASWGQLGSFGTRIWIGSLSGIILARLDQLIMVPISGAEQLGLYAVAVSVSEVALVVSNAVRDVSFSADAASNDAERLGLSARLALVSSAAVAVVLAAPLTVWLPFVFGSAFSAAALPCVILLAAAVIGTPGSVAGAGLSARGRPGLRSFSICFGAVVNVVLLIILLRPYGATGAAWATFGGNATAGMLNIVWIRRLASVSASEFLVPRASDVTRLFAMGSKVLRRRS